MVNKWLSEKRSDLFQTAFLVENYERRITRYDCLMNKTKAEKTAQTAEIKGATR